MHRQRSPGRHPGAQHLTLHFIRSIASGHPGLFQSGGYWPAELKFAGFDGIIISGRASSPVYLWIHEGKFEIRDAAHLWGRETGPAQAANPEFLKKLARGFAKTYRESYLTDFGKYGTSRTVGVLQSKGAPPSYSYSSMEFPGWKAKDGYTLV